MDKIGFERKLILKEIKQQLKNRKSKAVVLLGAILILLIIADAVSTGIALENPRLTEGNPNIRNILESSGITVLYFSAVGLSVLVVFIPFVYILLSIGIGRRYKKSSNTDQKTLVRLNRVFFIIFFLLLIILVAFRTYTVAKNIWLITIYS